MFCIIMREADEHEKMQIEHMFIRIANGSMPAVIDQMIRTDKGLFVGTDAKKRGVLITSFFGKVLWRMDKKNQRCPPFAPSSRSLRLSLQAPTCLHSCCVLEEGIYRKRGSTRDRNRAGRCAGSEEGENKKRESSTTSALRLNRREKRNRREGARASHCTGLRSVLGLVAPGRTDVTDLSQDARAGHNAAHQTDKDKTGERRTHRCPKAGVVLGRPCVVAKAD